MKLEARKKIEREKESGHEILEIGEQKIRELEEYLTFNIIEAIDDDKAAVEAARNESDDNFDIIPQDKDDGQSFDYVRCSLESVLTFNYEKQVFQEIVDKTEQNESEMQSKLEQLAVSLENLF
nr:hypothetical protein [Ruminococcus sp.]